MSIIGIDRMFECDGFVVDIYFFRIKVQVFFNGKELCSKCFISFNEINIC